MTTIRPYSDDYSVIMDFLREIYRQTRTQHCWLPQRWEYAEHMVNHLNVERGDDDWQRYIGVWEEHGRVVGLCHKEEADNAFLQVRPGYDALTDEMLDFAEVTIATETPEGKRRLRVWSLQSDAHRNEQLAVRGYARGDDGNWCNAQCLNRAFAPQLPDGYRFVSAVEETDTLKRANAVHTGFHPEEKPLKEVPEHFIKMEQAPLFRPDLELMSQYRDGTLTSFCVVWYDEITNTGMFEPVATHPNHRRRGLGKATLLEGLRRLQAVGAERAFVESYGDQRKAFYSSAGFETFDKDWYWTRER
jgi:ribosomal protein S18 acetylase RimI-like enzyme